MTENAKAAASERMRGYDLARALAIVGMVLINFPIFLANHGEAAGTLLAWFAHVHGGRAAALFVTVAGAGIALMARGAARGDVRRTLLLRALFLFCVGNALLLVWRIDILHFYAFYLALSALVLIALPRWTLPYVAIAIALATPVAHLFWPTLNEDVSVGFPWISDQRGEYWSAPGMLKSVFFSGIHPVFPWLSFIVMGLWIGGLDMADAGTRARVMVIGGALALGAPLVSTVLEALVLAGHAPATVLEFLGVAHAPSPLYVLGGVGTSMFLIAMCQAIIVRWGDALIVRALVHAGQLAFTIYIAHALLGVVIPQAIWRPDPAPLAGVIVYSLGFCAVVIVLAHLYRLRFERGPVETLMRRLAGNSPRKGARPERVTLRAPPRWCWPVLTVGLALVLSLQIWGAPPRQGCTSSNWSERVAGSLTLSCLMLDFPMQVHERADVTLETSSARDLYLELYRGDELIAQNDDGGVGANALVVATLDPGAYRVRVRPFEAALGAFVLTRADSAPTVRTLQPGEVCSDSCASARDGECDDGGPDSLYALCELGTDCGDCGIRSDADEQSMLNETGQLCSNRCASAMDRECDDGGPGSLYAVCAYGTDCGDCGARAPRLSAPPPP